MTKVLKYFLRVVMMLAPVFFLPVIMDAYGFGKVVFLLLLGMVGLLLWLAALIIEKKEAVKFNWGWGLFLLLTVWAGYLFFREVAAPGIQMKAIMSSSGLTALATVVVWGFLWLQVTDKEEAEKQLSWLTIGGLLVVVTSLVTFLIPASKLPIVWPKDNPLVSISAGWSLTGSLLSEAILMAFLAVEWGRRLGKKLKANGNYIMAAVLTAVFILVLALSLIKIKKSGWVVLDPSSSWVIAVEAFKRNPLTGIGIGDFSTAFNLYRPASYNVTKYWASGFNISINGWLQLWTELGIVGLGLIFLTILVIVRQKKDVTWVRLVLMLAAFLFLPVNLMIWWLLMWLLVSSNLETKTVGLVLKVGESGINAMPWAVAVVLVAAMAWSGFNIGKITAADYYYRQSLVAASKNDGGTTYNQQIKAIGINPLVSEYRRVYSQTNLALAVSLLTNKDITTADKDKASVLIQQSVREGKAAVSLDQLDVANWTNLAQIYRQIIGVVDGSPDWSYQAYQQAVVLDPTNPSLELDMGGLLYAAGKYEEADRLFEQAVTNKPDYANGWYNWAYNAKQMNRLADAVQRLTQAVALVPTTSADYEKANGELTVWKKELDDLTKKQQAATGVTPTPTPKPETLKAPAPQPTVGKEAKVSVPPQDLAPPTIGGQATPAVTAVPTGTPKPTVTVTPTGGSTP
ncbi:MAG: hypothetical protein NTY75_03455 [Candidatus Shapirobacteria bacterium]|nr:hypothetical protein [Candidatus Shapirobacteria bacterium]